RDLHIGLDITFSPIRNRRRVVDRVNREINRAAGAQGAAEAGVPVVVNVQSERVTAVVVECRSEGETVDGRVYVRDGADHQDAGRVVIRYRDAGSGNVDRAVQDGRCEINVTR